MSRRVLSSLLLSFAIPLSTMAQEPQSTTPPAKQNPPIVEQNPPVIDDQDVVRITTNLVQVDAVVTRDGKQVTDLKVEDFELLEDGRPQAITHFSYISNVLSMPAPKSATTRNSKPADKNAPPVLPVAAQAHEVRRTVALVVDDLGMSFESLSRLRQQVRKFIDQKLEPNDLVAIVRTGGEVGALQQFTTDRRILYDAIDHLRWNPCSRTGLYVFAPSGSPTTPSDVPCGGGHNIKDTLNSLKFIVEGMRDLPGRKSLVLFSDHLPIETQEPATTNSQVESESSTSAIDTGDADFDNSRDNYAGQLHKVAELAIRSSVVIYAVDTRGLAYTGLTAADRFSGNGRAITNQMNSIMANRSAAMIANREGSQMIARQTGGFLVFNSNDFGLDRIADDQKGYYLLGYRPTGETFNRQFHHIKLKVKGRGLTVRTREGFYGISEEQARPRELTPGDQLKKALMSPFGASDIGLRLTTVFTNFAQTGSLLRSLIYIKAQDLTFVDEPDGAHKATFDLGVILFGDNGSVRDQQSRLVTLRLREELYQAALKNGVVYTMDTPLKITGSFQFRIALRDQNSARVGSAGQFIQIPNLHENRPALSGLLILKGDRDKPDSSPTDDSISSGPAVRQFNPGGKILSAFSIYNAQISPATNLPDLIVQTRIFRDGKVVFTGQPTEVTIAPQSDLKRIPNLTPLQLGADFPPGFYVLQVLVTDRLVKDNRSVASQWSDFEIVK